jgi:hypothetical protein
MNIKKLPRGTFAARLTCLDLMSRVNQSAHCLDGEVVCAANLVVRYLMDPSFHLNPNDLTAYQQTLQKLYC